MTKIVFNNILPRHFNDNGVLDITKLGSTIPSEYAIRLELSNIQKDIVIPNSIVNKSRSKIDICMFNCNGRVLLEMDEYYGVTSYNVSVNDSTYYTIRTMNENQSLYEINIELLECVNLQIDTVINNELYNTINYTDDEFIEFITYDVDTTTIETTGDVVIDYENNYNLKNIVINNNHIGCKYIIGETFNNFKVNNSTIISIEFMDNTSCNISITSSKLEIIDLNKMQGNIMMYETHNFCILGKRIKGLLSLVKCNNSIIKVEKIDSIKVEDCKSLNITSEILYS